MAECEHIGVCAFFNDKLGKKEGKGSFYKQMFCLKKPEKCMRKRNSAIYRVEDVKNDMHPLGVGVDAVENK